MIHVEENGSSFESPLGGLWMPITRRKTPACEIVGPPLVRPGRHDDALRIDLEYGFDVSRLTGFDLDAGFARLPFQPCNQTAVFAAARKTNLPVKLPANLG